MGKVVTVLNKGGITQTIFESGEGGLNVQVKVAGHELKVSLDEHLEKEPVDLIIRHDGLVGEAEYKLELAEGNEDFVGSLSGFTVRHLKG